MLRSVLAANPSPMTLDGTRTWIVGRRRAAVIDPGPADPAHLDAVASLLAAEGDALAVAILVTHDHPDHAAGASPLAVRLGARVRAAGAGTLAPGDRIATDAGELVAVPTPGHAPDHFAFHWPAGEAVFCGDLMLGGQATALVASPEGDLADYLTSLERVRALAPRVIHPSHGPSFEDPPAALDAYVRHREDRLRQVLGALAAEPRTAAELTAAVYGDALDPRLVRWAAGAVDAYLAFLERDGRIARAVAGRWRAVG